MAYLGGIHFWWPKMTGRMYPELWGKLSALMVFVGFNLTFFPQFVLGYLGMPRRYYEYPPEFQVLNVMSTAGASILAVGYVLPLVYLLLSLRRPPNAGPEPLGRDGPGVADRLAAAGPQLRRDPRRDRGALRVLARRGGGMTMEHDDRTRPRPTPSTDDEPILSHQFDDLEQQQRGVDAGHVDLPGHRGHVLRRPDHGLRRLPGRLSPTAFALASRQLNIWLGCVNTVVLLTSSLTMALAVRAGAAASAPRAGPSACSLTMVLGTAFLGIKAVEYYQEYHEHLIPGLELPGPASKTAPRSSRTHSDPRADARCSSSSTSS